VLRRLIRWLLKQPGIALMPVVGDTHRSRINLVPRDFVIAAISYLSGQEKALGKTGALDGLRPMRRVLW
jgi:hypothetical protein